jgi:hypothetical protein
MLINVIPILSVALDYETCVEKTNLIKHYLQSLKSGLKPKS